MRWLALGWSMTALGAFLACGQDTDPPDSSAVLEEGVGVPPAPFVVEVTDSDEEPLPDWTPPATGRVSSRFGDRREGWHDALDVAAPIGTPVVAPADLRVRTIAYEGRAGRY